MPGPSGSRVIMHGRVMHDGGMKTKLRRAALVAVPSLAASLAAGSARAEESVIKNPGDHPDYHFEAEPHGVIGFAGPFGSGLLGGVGFRGTIPIVQNGFIKKINNSVGIGFGADIGFNGTVFIPVVMQWNFWLSTHWSVFGEPGLGLAFGEDRGRGRRVGRWWSDDNGRTGFYPLVLFAGGRYHFNEKIALTMRIGFPVVSVGVSFLF